MSRWKSITADDLKAAGHGALIDRARSVAVGGLDPVEETIADAVARVRRAVASGNVLDIDPATVPASLHGVTKKLAIYDLMERISAGAQRHAKAGPDAPPDDE